MILVKREYDSRLSDARGVETIWEGEHHSRANLAYALDLAEHDAIEGCGANGGTSCWVVIEPDAPFEDEEFRDVEHDEMPSTLTPLDSEERDFDDEDAMALNHQIWNGHNHVTFTASRSMRFCENTSQVFGPFKIMFRDGRRDEFEDISTDSQVTLWLTDEGGDGDDTPDGCSSYDDCCRVLNKVGISYENGRYASTDKHGIEDYYIEMIVVSIDDESRARAALRIWGAERLGDLDISDLTATGFILDDIKAAIIERSRS